MPNERWDRPHWSSRRKRRLVEAVWLYVALAGTLIGEAAILGSLERLTGLIPGLFIGAGAGISMVAFGQDDLLPQFPRVMRALLFAGLFLIVTGAVAVMSDVSLRACVTATLLSTTALTASIAAGEQIIERWWAGRASDAA